MSTSLEALKIVIVGGVAGGASAAARARRVNANAHIILLEKGDFISFANCGLPYHIGGEIAERSKLLVANPKLFWDRFRVHVHTNHEVTEIDRAARCVRGKRRDGTEFSVNYDRLILATGSEPMRPEFFAEGAENVFHLWTLEDMDRILAHTRAGQAATVVGAGFVGLEVVEQLKRRGMQVTLVERLPQVLGPLDFEMAKLVEEELRRESIQLHMGATIDRIEYQQQRAVAVNLASGPRIATDLVIVGAGVRPRTQLAVQAGLAIGPSGGVQVNAWMQTSDPKIYAVGDMAEYQHGVTHQPTRMPLAGPANRSGRVAGTHAASTEQQESSPTMGSVFGTSIVRVFKLTAGATGLNERACRAAQIDYRVATIQAAHHASYFPGAKNLVLKLLYRPTDGQLLGAQAVGEDGVDKRLDVIATALHFSGTVADLSRLDLAYAPPFGSAKDPIHMVAFAAENDLRSAPKLAPTNTPVDGLQVVDVRNQDELLKLPLEGAIHIPVDAISERWSELDPNLPTLVVCHSGKRAHVAACLLQGKGFKQVLNLNGGMSIRRLTEQ